MNLLHMNHYVKTGLLCGVLWASFWGSVTAEPVNIIPRPLHVSQTEGSFRLTSKW